MDEYLRLILNKKSSNYDAVAIEAVKKFFYPIVIEWSNGYLNDYFVAGSIAKGVSIKGRSDFDFFVSVKSSCNNSLSEIYNTLFNTLSHYSSIKGFTVRKQNVSLGIKGLLYNYIPIDVDIVPAKQHAINSNYHSLYKSKQDSWIQTNVKGHIDLSKNSGRRDFIKLIKIWRECHKLEFPSINLELSVLEALKGYSYYISLERGFNIIMEYFVDSFVYSKIVDPYNTNNIVSNDMTDNDKLLVKEKAKQTFSTMWRNIIW